MEHYSKFSKFIKYINPQIMAENAVAQLVETLPCKPEDPEFELLIDIILPAPLWPWSLLSL
jgi:hypothetical protein